MTPQGQSRLLALLASNREAGDAMAATRERFARIANRATNGSAPVAVATHQLFQTPAHIAARLVELLDISPEMRVLEPSAGLGRLLDALPDGLDVVAVEKAAECCKALRGRPGLTVRQADFLTLTPSDLGTFDRVIMNPPFTMRSDIRHVRHAMTFLRPGGLLASVVMAGPQREQAFEGWEWHDLPEGSFRESNTSVPTAIVVYQKP